MRGVRVDPRLLRHARATFPYLAGCVLLGLAIACCAIAQARLLAHAIATVTVPVALGVVLAARPVLAWAQDTLAARTSAKVRSALRTALVQAALRDPARVSSAEMATLVTRGVDALDPYFARYLPQLALATIVPLAVTTALLTADPTTAVIVLITIPLIPLFGALIGSHAAARTTSQWRTLELLAGHFADVVAGLATLKVFGRAHAQAAHITRITAAHRRATLRTLRLAFCSALVLELAATLLVALVAVSVGLRLLSGTLSFETALFVLILAPEAYLPLRLAGTHFHTAQEGLAAADRILATLDAIPAVPAPRLAPDDTTTPPDPSRNGPAPRRLAAGHTAQPVPAATVGGVGLDGVVAGYGGRAVVGPVSMEVVPGEVTAVTGPSGCGKSTLLAVLLGFAVPMAGRLVIGGIEVAGPDERFWTAWRRTVAWVPQRPTFRTGTVAGNIALAVPDAPAAAVRDAAKTTGVTEWTDLDAPLAAGGGGLSAGQRQRVAMARAVLRCHLLDIRLLLLDEPTAHLDVAAELDLCAAIGELLPGRTALVVTHRQTPLALADHIVHLPATARETVPA